MFVSSAQSSIIPALGEKVLSAADVMRFNILHEYGHIVFPIRDNFAEERADSYAVKNFPRPK